MRKVSFLRRAMMFALAAILGFGPCFSSLGTLEVQAATTANKASYADDKSEVGGYWYYSVNGQQVENKNSDLLNKLPYEGSAYRYTTDNYDANYGAFDTSNWATSFMWDLDGDNPYSSTVYAIPLAFRASVDGGAKNIIQVTAPSRLSDTANNTYTMQMPSNGSLTDFFIQTSFDVSSAKVDAITDWTYDVVMENSSDATQYLKTTMVQGSIFAYFELKNDNSLTITRGRGLPAAVAYTNDAGNVIVIRCMDNMNNDYDYYAFYGAEGTTFDVTTSGNMISSIDVQFSKDSYMSLAYLGASQNSPDDSWGASMCQAYLPYAYNFVTNTTATYSYEPSTSTVTTVYQYEVDKKVAGAPDGTIMGVLPHQYKNIKEGTQFLDHTYETVRGTMKTIAGSSFTTELTYSGILPFMPDYSDDSTEETTISTYLKDFTDGFSSDYFENYEGTGDTYWDGKGLNRLANAMAAAEAAGEVSLANTMYESLKSRLEEWFTYGGLEDSTYFYYDSGVGSMFGFPQSYDSVNQINDHHFHYGYFIYAAAQVAFRDTTGTWVDEYGSLVNELINDIACSTRNSADSRYPYLRNFAPYEGHSWASGHANFDMGNNQESSSEALNAWAGIILWGEATGDTAIRDLGIYLYTTEISAVQNYWYDVDEDVLSDAYRYKVGANEIDTIDKSTAKVENNSAAIVWGGSYTYATWFSANPLYIQGINLLPMNPTCFYLAGDADYIQQNWDLAYEKASAAGWDMESWVDIWCQYYAMAFPEAALAQWKSVEEGTDSYGVEGGDTKAHTYHFIKSLCTYGTPDTSITSNATLSTVFVKDGVKTYIAYNASSSALPVTFSDGYQITVPANSMKVEKEGEAANQAKYTIQYYMENTDGEYVLDTTLTKYGTVGETVSVSAKEMSGYVYDATQENVTEAEITEDGNAVLKLYYKRATYTITYVLNAEEAVNDSNNPQTYQYKDSIVLLEPTYSYYRFLGWYKDEALTSEVTMIQDTDMGDITLYAAWQDPYVYELDATKVLTYEDGVITIAISGVTNEGSNTVDVLWKICEESQVDTIVSGGASALSGLGTTYDDTTGTWSAQLTESNGVTVGKYLVFMINTIRDGVGELSGVGVYEIPEESPYTMVNYYENFYQENLDGSFSLYETVKKKGKIGSEATCTEKTYTGFVYDSGNSLNVQSGTLSEETVTTLARYYVREEYNITYNLNGGEATGNPDTYTYGESVTLNNPTKSGYTFIGWYTNEECTVSFTGIKSTTTGDVTLYAKWVAEGSEQASYTVEHYKQSAEGSTEYTLDEEATESLQGYVGTTVYATAKTYEGYTENSSHSERVNSGIITEDGNLTLKLYYDIVATSDDSDTFGVTYDASTGTATFYYNGISGGTVYIKICDDQATAQGYVDAANAEWPGFDAVPGHAGYPMTSGTSGAQYQITVEEGKYIVYAFNPENKGVESWYMAVASSIDLNNVASYTVNHYKQDEAGSTNYTLAVTETLQGEVGTTVTATAKNYVGYTVNTNHANYVASGTVQEDGSLELAIYYDVNASEDDSYATPEGGGFTYDATTKIATFYYEGVTNGIVYIAAYDDLATATDIMEAANGGAGFSAVTGHGGYMLTQDGDRATADYAVAEGKYLVYAFNPGYAGVQDWYIGIAAEIQSGGEGDETTTASYKVEHYQQSAAGSTEYTLKETENLTGTVGSTVTATPKTYTGYTENTTHSERVPSGTVQEGGGLVLKLYYDISATGDDSGDDGYEVPEGGSYTYNETTGNVTFNATGTVTIYVAVFDDEASAKEAADAANASIASTGGDGFATLQEYCSSIPGYATSDTDGDGNYTVDAPVASGKYFVYCYRTSTIDQWYIGVATTTQSGGEEEITQANYTVEHHKQDSAGSEVYIVEDTETFAGTVGETVTATPKTYTGYTENTTHSERVASGEVKADGSLVLKLYYDVSTTGNDGGDEEYATPEGGSYTYNETTGNVTFNATATVTIYVAVFDTAAAAKEAADAANASIASTGGDGFATLQEYCSSIPGYATSDTDGDGNYTVDAPVASGKYFVYCYKTSTIDQWYIGVATASQSGGEVAPDPVEVSYTVKHYQQNADLNGYTVKDTENLKGYAGDEVTATVKTYTGFTHDDQIEETLLSGILEEGTALELSVYYTRNSYNITYGNMDNATNAAGNTSTYVYGVGLTLQAPTYQDDSFTFGGWYEDAECTTTPITAIAADRTGDVAVYAKWVAVDNSVSYTVEYYQQNTAQNGYDRVDSVTLSGEAGDDVTATINTYRGFTHNNQAEETLLSGTLAKDVELVLKVYYDRNTYTITYNNMDGATNAEANKDKYVYGVGLTLQNPTKEGYTFGGWFTDADFINPITEIGTDSIDEVVVYAKWTKNITHADYVIKYYLETTTPGSYVEVIGDRVEGNDLIGKLIEAEAKEYEGYYLNTEVEGSLQSGNLAANEVLTLKLFYDRRTYNITYHNVEGATNPEENAATYTYGEGFTLLDASKTDYIFGGWYSDEACSADKRVTQITNLQTGDVELYAKWIKESANYTIRFYQQNKAQNGYEEVTQDVIVGNNEVGTVIDAVSYGYAKDYTGFKLNETHEEGCLSGTVSKTAPLTLKLYYDRETYDITYANMEGATNAEGNAATYVYGVGLTLQAPEKEGQIFAGWYLDSAFTEDQKIAAISTTLAEDVTVYAKWIDVTKAAAYTVYYYLQDVSLKNYVEVEEDRFVGSGEVGVKVLAPAKAYEGFELNTEAEGYLETGKVLEDGSLELKLYYDRCSYDITYHNMEDAVNPDTNTATYIYGIGLALANPSRGDYVFEGWYTNEGMAEEDKIVKISDTQVGAVNLYAKWTEYVAEEEVEIEPDQEFTVDEIEDQYYTGSKIKPYVVVKDGDKVLVEKKDYTLKFTNNVKAGFATVKITGKGNYSGIVERTFEIKRVDIGTSDMAADDIYVAVNKSGKAIAVKPKLVWGKKTLKMNTDYKISGASSYSQPGTYEVTLEGIGNYTGTRKLTFTIAEKEEILMSKVKVAKIASQYYRNGAVIEPELKVTYKGEVLVEGVDYEAEYLNNTQAGTATVIITGTGDTYVGERKVTFKIVGTALSKMGISLNQTEFEYTGDSIYPEYFSGDLKAGKDFTVTYSGNKKVGKGTVTFTGIGAYTGTVKKTFKIVPYNIANNVGNYFTDTTGAISVEYVKAGCTPKVEVRFRGNVLTEGTDYTLKYSQNKAVGTGTITVTGKGTYKGTYKKDFTIKKGNLADVLIIPTDIVEKSGKNASYYMTKVTLTDSSGKKLAAGKDYDKAMSYAYKNANGDWISFDKDTNIGNLAEGTVLRVTVTGIGNYENTVTAEYRIIAATANIKSAKVKINDKAYTGEEVVLTKDDFEYITLNGVSLTYGTDYEIVEDSYVKNTTKGTAKVTIRGIGEYGGTKTVTFKIGARSLKDIITGIFKN